MTTVGVEVLTEYNTSNH